MGRIKTALTKRITFKLLDAHKEKFSTDYSKNKKLVQEHSDVSSKKLRNIIAGYISRQIKNKDKERPRAKNKEDLSQFY